MGAGQLPVAVNTCSLDIDGPDAPGPLVGVLIACPVLQGGPIQENQIRVESFCEAALAGEIPEACAQARLLVDGFLERHKALLDKLGQGADERGEGAGMSFLLK